MANKIAIYKGRYKEIATSGWMRKRSKIKVTVIKGKSKVSSLGKVRKPDLPAATGVPNAVITS